MGELLLMILVPFAIGSIWGIVSYYLRKNDIGTIIVWILRKIGYLLAIIFVLGILGVFNLFW